MTNACIHFHFLIKKLNNIATSNFSYGRIAGARLALLLQSTIKLGRMHEAIDGGIGHQEAQELKLWRQILALYLGTVF